MKRPQTSPTIIHHRQRHLTEVDHLTIACRGDAAGMAAAQMARRWLAARREGTSVVLAPEKGRLLSGSHLAEPAGVILYRLMEELGEAGHLAWPATRRLVRDSPHSRCRHRWRHSVRKVFQHREFGVLEGAKGGNCLNRPLGLIDSCRQSAVMAGARAPVGDRTEGLKASEALTGCVAASAVINHRSYVPDFRTERIRIGQALC